MDNTKPSEVTRQPQPYESVAEQRSKILTELRSIVCKDRLKTHGTPEENFQPTADIWNVILRHKLKEPITSLDVPAMMAAFKLARFSSNPTHRDNLLDAAGYSICGVAMLPIPEPLIYEA